MSLAVAPIAERTTWRWKIRAAMSSLGALENEGGLSSSYPSQRPCRFLSLPHTAKSGRRLTESCRPGQAFGGAEWLALLIVADD
jgi:hypothetical protein